MVFCYYNSSFSRRLLLVVVLHLTLVVVCKAGSSSSSSATLLLRRSLAGYQPAGWQSGPDLAATAVDDDDDEGSSFASDVAYDPVGNTITVTGSTYGAYFQGDDRDDGEQQQQQDDFATAGCFLSTFSLPSATSSSSSSSQQQQQVEQLKTRKFHVAGVPEACQSLVLADSGKRVFTAGHMERGGLLEPLLRRGGGASGGNRQQVDDVVQYGMVLDVEYSSSADNSKNNDNVGDDGSSNEDDDQEMNFVGGYLMGDAVVVQPVSVDLDESGDFVLVASMESDDTSRNQGGQEAHVFGATTVDDGVEDSNSNAGDYYNNQDPATTLRYGKAFSLSVQSLRRKKQVHYHPNTNNNNNVLQESFSQSWHRVYATDNRESVHPAKIHSLSKQLVLVAGSTAGTGKDDKTGLDVFGARRGQENNGTAGDDSDSSSNNVDGFLLRLHPQHGDVFGAPGHPEKHASLRIASIDGKDDWVTSVCYHNRANSEDHDVYVVGTTAGQMEGAAAAVVAAPAAASSSGDQSAQQQQAFVMKVNAEQLKIEWTVQIDGAAVAAAVAGDEEEGGAASVTGEKNVHGSKCAVTPTGGELYVAGTVVKGENSNRRSNVWLAQLDAATGDLRHARTVVVEDSSSENVAGLTADGDGNAVVVANTAGGSLYRKRTDGTSSTDVVLFTVSRDQGLVAPVIGAGAEGGFGVFSAAVGTAENRREMLLGVLLGLIAAVIVAVLFANRGYFFGCWGDSNRDMIAETNRSRVLPYLRNFHVEDIDMKHSATGGWHCSYSNELAMGLNRGNPDAVYANHSSFKTTKRGGSTRRMNKVSSCGSSSGGGGGVFKAVPSGKNNKKDSSSSIVDNALFMDDDDDEDDSESTEQTATASTSENADTASFDHVDLLDIPSRNGSSNPDQQPLTGYDGMVDAYSNGSSLEDRSRSVPQ